MSTATATTRRDQIEQMVRAILRRQLANRAPAAAEPAAYRPHVVANISARHCHLTQADVNVLFAWFRKLNAATFNCTLLPSVTRKRFAAVISVLKNPGPGR